MYVTMSHLEASEMTDEIIEKMQTKFMPMIKSLGADTFSATLVMAEEGPIVANMN